MRYLREKFTRYLHSKDKNITFSYEKESNDSLVLLDILISISNNGFKRSVHHKLTFSGVCSNFKSFIHGQYKIGLALTLLFQTFSIVSDFSRFHTEVGHIKDILGRNAIPIKLVDNCIKAFLNKKFLHAPVALTVEKKELLNVLPYFGNLSLALKARLQNNINGNLCYCILLGQDGF